MEKIKLSNNQEFDLIPMGITVDTANKRRYFKFTSSLTYAEILALFSASENLTTVSYILADTTVGATYTDCVALKSLSYIINYKVDDLTTANIYVAEISTDAAERSMQSLQSEIADLKQKNQTLQETIDALVISNLEV